MLKHIRYTFTILTLLSLYSCSNSELSPEQLSLDAIPVGSMLICEIQDPQPLKNGLIASKYLSAFSNTDVVNKLDQGYRMMLALTASPNGQMTIAAAPVGAKDLSWIYIGKSRSNPVSFASDTTVTVSKYEKDDIFTIGTPTGEFYYYNKGSLVVGSTDRLYLEQSLLQHSSGISLKSVEGFDKVCSSVKTSKNINIIVNTKVLDRYISKSLSFDKLSIVPQMSPWYVCDIDLTDSSKVTINGVLSHNDSIVTFADVLSGQKAHTMTMDNYFPSSTTLYTYYGVSDWGKFWTDYSRQLKDASLFHLYNTKLQDYTKILGGSIPKFFGSWAGVGLAVVQTSGAVDLEEGTSVFIGVKDAKVAESALGAITDSTFGVVETYRDYRIMALKDKNIFKDLIGKGFGAQGMNYYAVLGDVVVFAYNTEVLKYIINDIVDLSTLSTLEDYKKAKASLATKSNMLTMLRGNLWAVDIVEQSKVKRKAGITNLSEVENFIIKNPKALSDHRFNFVQLSSTNGIPLLSLSLQLSNNDTSSQPRKLWSYNMLSRASISPVAFPNHKNGKYDILIQDQNNILYLISDQGKLHWKKDLGTVISSDIAVVDLYDNKKYQMAFYTGSKYHVIDRLGNYVTDKARIQKAKDYKKPTKDAFVSSTNTITVIKNGKKQSIKTPQSPVSSVVYLPKTDIAVYSVSGKVWAIDSKENPIKGMPISGVDVFTAEDFSKNSRIGILCSNEQGVITMWVR